LADVHSRVLVGMFVFIFVSVSLSSFRQAYRFKLFRNAAMMRSGEDIHKNTSLSYYFCAGIASSLISGFLSDSVQEFEDGSELQ
jgi:hypothetical protein